MENENKPLPPEPPKSIFRFVLWVGKRIVHQKKWWLLPFWILLLVVALILILTGHGSILPVIYIAF